MENMTIENLIIVLKALALIAYNFWPAFLMLGIFCIYETYQDKKKLATRNRK
tara:strand:- start:1080 stop:1235 length:156 start_codon:yes stop_codon:yes gene_type:complete